MSERKARICGIHSSLLGAFWNSDVEAHIQLEVLVNNIIMSHLLSSVVFFLAVYFPFSGNQSNKQALIPIRLGIFQKGVTESDVLIAMVHPMYNLGQRRG